MSLSTRANDPLVNGLASIIRTLIRDIEVQVYDYTAPVDDPSPTGYIVLSWSGVTPCTYHRIYIELFRQYVVHYYDGYEEDRLWFDLADPESFNIERILTYVVDKFMEANPRYIKYEVIKATNLAALQATVADRLAKGYITCGGVTQDSYNSYLQSVVLPAPNQ